jgi:galactokinase
MSDRLSVPGRVNLIGEHIDYHNLPVLPMAIGRRIRVEFEARSDDRVTVRSEEFGEREFNWIADLAPAESGDWVNYVRAAAKAVGDRWGIGHGISAQVTSDLPAAAGLSSSSALLVAFVLALLRANRITASFEELMEVLPEAEYFVGTRGGGMDHAAVLAPQPGHALLVHFAPVSVEHVPVPDGWAFLVAHSLTTAEKSGGARLEFNARRTAGGRALQKLGLRSYAEAGTPDLSVLNTAEREAFLHVSGERDRVAAAVAAMRCGDAQAFGKALNASHDSLRDLLRVSCPALDELVEKARTAGALGARVTGAGFGGCAVIFCERTQRDRIAHELCDTFYAGRHGFNPDLHLLAVEPSAGALHD